MTTPIRSFETPAVEDKSDFIESIDLIQDWAHAVNRYNGFWEDRDKLLQLAQDHGLGDKMLIQLVLANIALIHTEPSEGAEAVRKQPAKSWRETDKDTLASELAGAVVRIMDLSAALNLPLGEAIVAEITRNESRGYMHGGKAA